MKLRRLGAQLANCCNKLDCPNVFEMESGDFVVVGQHRTADIKPFLPPNAGCGPEESIVVIPRSVFLAAAKDV